jgi:putative ABC transport system permease protein
VNARVELYEGTRIALGSLRANRLRTGLTVAAVGIGVATLLSIVAIIQGLNASFARQLASLGTSTLNVSRTPQISMGPTWWMYRNRRQLTVAQLQAVADQSRYAAFVVPELNEESKDISSREQTASGVDVVGTLGDYQRIGGYEVPQGRFITDADSDNERFVIVLGSQVAEALFPDRSALGESVRIDNRPYRVVGVLAPKGQLLGQSLDLVAFVPFRSFLSIYGKRDFQIDIGVDDAKNLDKAEDEITGILRRVRNVPADKPDDFSIFRAEQLADTYNSLTGALYGVAVAVGVITLIVGGIGIMNIMLVSVRERTREIGIRRALGARRRTIVVQFLLEASAVSALGGVIGTAVGLGLAKLVAAVTSLTAAVQPVTIVAGVGFAALVGLVFGIWPAARAAQLDPVEALRHE